MFDQTLPYDLGENTAWCVIGRTADLLAMAGGGWVVVRGGRRFDQLGSIVAINPCTRSGAKLYFPKTVQRYSIKQGRRQSVKLLVNERPKPRASA